MIAAVDCSPSTIACELASIAEALTDKPSWFDWLQLGVTALSVLATVAVGVIAARIAYQSHRLAAQVEAEARARAARESRLAFHRRAQQFIDDLMTSPPETAFDHTSKFLTESLASGDRLDSAIASQLADFAKELASWSPTDRKLLGPPAALIVKTAIAVWASNPPSL